MQPNQPTHWPAVLPLVRNGRLIGTCTNYTPGDEAGFARGYCAVEGTPRYDAVLLVWRREDDPLHVAQPLRIVAWRGDGPREVLPVPHYNLVACQPGKDWYFTNNDVLDEQQRAAVFRRLVHVLQTQP